MAAIAPFELNYANGDKYSAAVRSGAAILPRKLSAQALLLADDSKRVFSGVEPLMIWKFDTRKLAGIISVPNAQDIAVLETFLIPRTLEEAFAEFTATRNLKSLTTTSSSSTSDQVAASAADDHEMELSETEVALMADFVLQGVMLSTTAAPLTWMPHLVHLKFDTVRLIGVTISTGALIVKPYAGSLVRLFLHLFPCTFDSTTVDRTLDLAAFQQAVTRAALVLGMVAPLSGQATPVDLVGRLNPMCNAFGFSRGTPLGRYYLEQFLRVLRPRLRGRVLEVGGDCESQKKMALDSPNLTEYVTCDLLPYGRPNVVGDATVATLFEPGSFDIILAFNVLEHCRQPWNVLKNFALWLRPGGEVAVQVPNAQVVHRTPIDCFRILPDGMRAMYEDAGFTDITMHPFGNLHTTTSSLAGLSAEDVDPALIDIVDERYPVVTCCIGKK